MKFNLDSLEVKNAKRSSEQAGRQMWNSDEKPELIKVKIKKVRITSGKKYYSGWGWPMYEIETNKGVYISAHGPATTKKSERRDIMRRNQNNGKSLSGILSGGGNEVFWDDKKYRKKKMKVVTGPSDRVPDWTWIYFIHENDTKEDAVKSNNSRDDGFDFDLPTG